MLKRCAMLGTLTCKKDLLFILRQIREATAPISAEDLVELRPVPEPGSFFEEPVLPVLRTHPRVAPAPVAERHLPEQLGIPFWALVLAGGLMWNVAIRIYRWRITSPELGALACEARRLQRAYLPGNYVHGLPPRHGPPRRAQASPPG